MKYPGILLALTGPMALAQAGSFAYSTCQARCAFIVLVCYGVAVAAHGTTVTLPTRLARMPVSKQCSIQSPKHNRESLSTKGNMHRPAAEWLHMHRKAVTKPNVTKHSDVMDGQHFQAMQFQTSESHNQTLSDRNCSTVLVRAA
jgi:hypothetical protein